MPHLVVSDRWRWLLRVGFVAGCWGSSPILLLLCWQLQLLLGRCRELSLLLLELLMHHILILVHCPTANTFWIIQRLSANKRIVAIHLNSAQEMSLESSASRR